MHTQQLQVFARISVMLLMLAMMLTTFLYRVPGAQASGGGLIVWDSSMIYSGQNNGNPWGPVGERALLHVSYLPNQQLNLVLVPGDAYPGDGNYIPVCQQAGSTLGSVTTNNNGKADYAFDWPSSAGQVNQGYSVCSVSPDGTIHTGSRPFTVLASSPPVISLSTSSVAAGDTVTVTGQNWVPPQNITVNIAGCADCEPGNTEVTSASVHSSGLNNGSFSATITIPASTKPGNYVVDALSQNGLLDANYTTTNGARPLTITAQTPTPTPTPTIAPTPTPTAVPSPTSAPTAVATPLPASSSSSSNNGSNPVPIIGLFIAVALVLAAIIGIIVYMVRRRTSRQRRPLDVPTAFTGQFMQQATPGGSYNDPPVRVQQASSAGSSSDPARTRAGTLPSNPYNDPTWAVSAKDLKGAPQAPFRTPMPPVTSPGQFSQTIANTFPGSSTGNRVRSTPSLFCVRCGGSLEPDDTFCGQCGTPVAPQRADGDAPTFIR